MASQSVFSQKQIAITIDDVPNTKDYHEKNESVLVKTLDELQIPVAIFLNEGLLFKHGNLETNKNLLKQWLSKEYVTPGNHTKNHLRYSEVGFDAFTEDVLNGFLLTEQIIKKPIEPKFFRFPYNDLGADSTQHIAIQQFLSKNGYVLTPHTTESSDWMFNVVYEHYLALNDSLSADLVGKAYVDLTLRDLAFSDSLSNHVYGRSIKHIYLCHDNPLNATFLPVILDSVIQLGYEIISLETALTDPLYKQDDVYYKKWGVSWLFRWMRDEKERMMWMRKGPENEIIRKKYEEIMK